MWREREPRLMSSNARASGGGSGIDSMVEMHKESGDFMDDGKHM